MTKLKTIIHFWFDLYNKIKAGYPQYNHVSRK